LFKFSGASHTGEHLKTLYRAVAKLWGIEEKVVAFVVDNARNMVNAINLTGFNLINCTAHTMQLAIHDAIDNNQQLQVILLKCRAIVGHFKRSNIDKAKLVETQKKLDITVHKLIQEVRTRWNSTYYMLDRILEQRQPLTFVISTIESIECLINDEWK
jgi:hypothetical protein